MDRKSEEKSENKVILIGYKVDEILEAFDELNMDDYEIDLVIIPGAPLILCRNVYKGLEEIKKFIKENK